MIGRRTLIRIAAFAGAPPALAAPVARPSTARSRLAPTRSAGDTDAMRVAFKIEGWEGCRDDAASSPNVGSGTEAWFRVNRSWRVAWR
jgi:hypothetical protein